MRLILKRYDNSQSKYVEEPLPGYSAGVDVRANDRPDGRISVKEIRGVYVYDNAIYIYAIPNDPEPKVVVKEEEQQPCTQVN